MAAKQMVGFYIVIVLLSMMTITTEGAMKISDTFYANLNGTAVKDFFQMDVDSSGITDYGYFTDSIFLWRFNTKAQEDNNVTDVIQLQNGFPSSWGMIKVTPRAVIVWLQRTDPGDSSGVFILVNPQTFQVFLKVRTSPYLTGSMVISPMGEYLYCSRSDQKVDVFDLRTFSFVAQYPVPSSCASGLLTMWGGEVYVLAAESGMLCRVPIGCHGGTPATYTFWNSTNAPASFQTLTFSDRFAFIGVESSSSGNLLVSADPCNHFAIKRRTPLDLEGVMTGRIDRTADNILLWDYSGIAQVDIRSFVQTDFLTFHDNPIASGAYDASQNIAFVGGVVADPFSNAYFVSKILLSS